MYHIVLFACVIILFERLGAFAPCHLENPELLRLEERGTASDSDLLQIRDLLDHLSHLADPQAALLGDWIPSPPC